jgi:hypothetical protein
MVEKKEERKPRYATLGEVDEKVEKKATKTKVAKKKKASPPKQVPEVVEVIKEVAYVPKRYEVEIYKKSSPLDILAGRYGYYESTDEIKLLEYRDNFGAQIEDLLLGDIMVDGVGISVHNDKKNWITNLCNTEMGYKFYSTPARELNETE